MLDLKQAMEPLMGLPTTIACVEDEELRLGLAFPNILKKLLVQANGGNEVCVDGELWLLFPVKDFSSRKHATRSANHIEKETHISRNWAGFPQTAVAIGENGSGDKLVIFPDLDVMFVWDHETGETNRVVSFIPYVPS